MEYFILLAGDDLSATQYDCNKLGQTNHLQQFWAFDGFRVLNNIVNNHPEQLADIKILDNHKKYYSITEFLNLLKNYKLII